jgi:acetolactate synthase I/II/III large subunit
MAQSDGEILASTTAGGAIFRRLGRLGVDLVFVNPGTDFPPLIEGLAEAEAESVVVPRALVVGHEMAAIGMAHGYYLITGRAQAAILHTNVGLSNGITALLNAASDYVPIVLMSGRTPTVERGRTGARTVPIGWGQEMRDQTALVRESTKWDYELRFPEQVGELLDRAYAIGHSTPKGPVYLSLPREVLCEPCPSQDIDAEVSMQPAVVVAADSAMARAAEILSGAERPLIISQRGAGSAAGFAALARLSEQWSIPVCQYWAVANAISAEHPMHIGDELQPWIAEADVVLVIDSLAPWAPDSHRLSDECQVIQLGPDPLHSRVPVRNFRVNLAITTEVGPGIEVLEAELRKCDDSYAVERANRRASIDGYVLSRRAGLAETASKGSSAHLTKAYVSRSIGEAVEGHTATVLSELGAAMEFVGPTSHDSWRRLPHSGGLGWALPCALGMKLADPDRLVIATMGDGSYLFANPVACHQVAEAYDIAVLSIVFNNAAYGVVGQAVLGMYPTGYAAKEDEVPLTRLLPCPDFVKIAEASRAFAERVDHADNLASALERAIHAVTVEGRQALLDVRIDG